ncbi:hypothetical protein JOQ06_028685, partial [Pogonophryne albipinna]
MLRKKGLDTSVHHSSITEDDFKAIKQVLDPKTPEGLVNKVWFDVQLHFGRRGNEGNRQLKPSSFTTKTDENGLKYATLTFNEHTKNHNDPQARNKESTRGFMCELPGDPLCPVSSLEKYISLLPPDAPAFYLHPRRQVNCNVDNVWFTREPMGMFVVEMLFLQNLVQADCSRQLPVSDHRSDCWQPEAAGDPVIDEALDLARTISTKKHNEQVKKNRDILRKLIIAALYLARQEQAFRGHNEAARSSNRGNFVELVRAFAELDTALAEHLGSSTVFSGGSAVRWNFKSRTLHAMHEGRGSLCIAFDKIMTEPGWDKETIAQSASLKQKLEDFDFTILLG